MWDLTRRRELWKNLRTVSLSFDLLSVWMELKFKLAQVPAQYTLLFSQTAVSIHRVVKVTSTVLTTQFTFKCTFSEKNRSAMFAFQSFQIDYNAPIDIEKSVSANLKLT